MKKNKILKNKIIKDTANGIFYDIEADILAVQKVDHVKIYSIKNMFRQRFYNCSPEQAIDASKKIIHNILF